MRIVVKVGTSTLTHATGNLNIRRMEQLCRVLSDIKNAGHEVLLVTSGAVGMGVGKLSLKERPTAITLKQAVAAVGQCELMYTYDREFSQYNHNIAQILLSAADVEDAQRRNNFHNTIFRLLDLGYFPSSMKTIPWPQRNWVSAIMIPSALLSPSAPAQIF